MKSAQQTQRQRVAAYLALFIATLIWAAATPVVKITLQYLPVFTFLLYRFLIVCIILLPFIIIELKKTPIHKADLPKIILLGIFGQTSIAFIFVGLKYTTSLDTAIIGILAPILAIGAGHYFYKEQIDNYTKLGIFIATIGTAIVVIEPIFTDVSTQNALIKRLMGNLFVVAYNLAFLMYIIWSKMILGQNSKALKRSLRSLHIRPMKKNYSALLITIITFYVGMISFVPLAIAEYLGIFGGTNIIVETLPLTPVFGVLYMAILSSIVAYVAFEWALNTITVGDSALFNYLSPILTLPFAYLLLHELPNKTMLIGAAIITGGIIIAEYKKP